jgi:hypothetical protein
MGEREPTGAANWRLARQEDLDLLNRLLEYELREDLKEAFSDMRHGLQTGARLSLSVRQRQWASEVLESFEPSYENAVSNGKVPRGREVPTPAVLQNLPKYPPGRKSRPDE